LVGAPLSRPVSYLGRDSLFPVPIIGWILRSTYVMPISRTATTTGPIKEAVRRMRHGFYVGIFPEGTRTRDGRMGVVKPGFIALVRRANVPVYPVGIAGAYRAFPRGTLAIRRRRVRVVFGEPFSAEELEELCRRGREEDMAALAKERIAACQEEAEAWCRGETPWVEASD
jgi:1-acyl-sn-glycerol-3-phosphate acyltransferase